MSSNVMNLAIQFTAIDMLSGIVSRVKNHILSLGSAGEKVKKDFDDMTSSVTKGLKGLAVASFAVKTALPGIKAAGDLQEAMLRVKANLASGAKNAADLNNQLKEVKKSAIEISANAPFSAEDVVNIENALLKAGLSLKDVIGEGGAAWAATALASLTGEAPEMIGDSLARIGSQFKLEGKGYGELSDWIVRVDDATATSVPELIYGLRMAGSNAMALGISAKDSITTLGALAPLGERAGSAYNNMLVGMIGMSKEQKALLKAHKLDFFKDGKFIGMDSATSLLREQFGAITDDQKRLVILTKIFGEEGARAANTLINADKGFKEIEESAERAISIGEKMNIWSEGLNAALKKLAGTARSTLATMFDPMLAPLRYLVDLLNQATSKLGELAEKYKPIALGASAITGGAIVGAGSYALYHLLRGGLAGGRVLKGLLKGVGGTAAGIAEGKIVEAATGVTPVFVTNWPGYISGGTSADTVKDMAAGSAAAKMSMKTLGKAGILGGTLLGSYVGFTWLDKYFKVTDYGKIMNKLDEIESDKVWAQEQNKLRRDKIEITMNDNRTMVKADNMNTETDFTLNKGAMFPR